MAIWILFLIALALFFDYLNGFHDAANSVSTVVATRVLSPRLAVWWAAFFNFAALEFAYLVVGAAFKLLARFDRRAYRRGFG